jgi:hypothetical protein
LAHEEEWRTHQIMKQELNYLGCKKL